MRRAPIRTHRTAMPVIAPAGDAAHKGVRLAREVAKDVPQILVNDIGIEFGGDENFCI